jgi:hypothetical protein
MGYTKLSVRQNAYFIHEGDLHVMPVKEILINENRETYTFDCGGNFIYLPKTAVHETLDDLLHDVTILVNVRREHERNGM